MTVRNLTSYDPMPLTPGEREVTVREGLNYVQLARVLEARKFFGTPQCKKVLDSEVQPGVNLLSVRKGP